MWNETITLSCVALRLEKYGLLGEQMVLLLVQLLLLLLQLLLLLLICGSANLHVIDACP